MTTFARPLTVLATAVWDGTPPPALAGFVHSPFSPLAAAVAEPCLRQVFGDPPPEGCEHRTAVVIVSASGDIGTAVRVAEAVDGGRRVGPLLFFQSVPNAVAGHIAARWGLIGPVVCLSPTGDPKAEGLAMAGLLIDDGDAEQALVILVEQASDNGERDSAEAVLVSGGVEL